MGPSVSFYRPRIGGAKMMQPLFAGHEYSCPRCGRMSRMIRLSLADLRRAGYEPFGRDFRSEPIQP